MPRKEIESHPFLELGKFKESTKLILGSFPVYECTNPDSAHKNKKREIEGTVFFITVVVQVDFGVYTKHILIIQLESQL